MQCSYTSNHSYRDSNNDSEITMEAQLTPAFHYHFESKLPTLEQAYSGTTPPARARRPYIHRLFKHFVSPICRSPLMVNH
jgi:hypothetical protein